MNTQTHNTNYLYAAAPLILLIVIDAMGMGIILPLLGPLFVSPDHSLFAGDATWQLRTFLYGLTACLFFIASFFAMPFVGDLSDQIGRKKVLLICLLLTAASYGIAAIGVAVSSIFLLMLGRAAAGFAAGSQAVAQAAMIDLSSDKNKALNLSFINAAMSLGFAFGPLIGGVFSNPNISQYFSYSTPFIIAGSLAIINTFGLVFLFRETFNPSTSPLSFNFRKIISPLLKAAAIKEVRFPAIIITFMQVAWSVYLQLISLLLVQSFNYTANQIAWFMVAIAIVFATVSAFVMRLLLKYVNTKIIAGLGLGLIFIGMLSTALCNTEWMQWLMIIPTITGVAISGASLWSLLSDCVNKESQGMIMGVTGSLVSIAWIFAGLLIGVVTAIAHIRITLIVAALFALLALILITYWRRN